MMLWTAFMPRQMSDAIRETFGTDVCLLILNRAALVPDSRGKDSATG